MIIFNKDMVAEYLDSNRMSCYDARDVFENILTFDCNIRNQQGVQFIANKVDIIVMIIFVDGGQSICHRNILKAQHILLCHE